MSDIHVRRIRSVLLREFKDLIDLSDVVDRPERDREQFYLTRSQAALALSQSAMIDKRKAADAVVDGFGDHGIDAVYFDEDAEVVYVLQSKWSGSGSKSPDQGSMEKFASGFKDLVLARFHRFNDKLIAKQETLERALDNPNVYFYLIVVYTGIGPLSANAEQPLIDLCNEMNNPIDIVFYRKFDQKALYSSISGSIDNASLTINVTLHHWGHIEEPYKAFYGQVSASEVAQWYEEHGTLLFTRNLRGFRGDTEINRAIKSTLVREPGKFWYFNNGITVLCSRIDKKPLGAANRDVGQFVCEGVSVVNGAQTVGSIAMTVSQGFPKAKDARVLVRFISLEDCPPTFASEVTTATNTQNRIEPQDFASLDPIHEQLRQDLKLDMSKTYVYKSGDRNPSDDDTCTIEEATIALACANPDVRLAAHAKRNLGVLWEDITRPPYKLIFNDRLTALRLWRCIEVLRVVEARLDEEKENRERQTTAWRIVVHGNRFILHRVFQILPFHTFDMLELNMDPILKQASEEVARAVDGIASVVEQHFPDSYLNSFFKSGSKCAELAQLLPKLPMVPHTPYFGEESGLGQLTLFENLELEH